MRAPSAAAKHNELQMNVVKEALALWRAGFRDGNVINLRDDGPFAQACAALEKFETTDEKNLPR